MKRLLIVTLTTLAASLLALARWLDRGGPSSPKSRTKNPKSVDLPRSHYRFAHVPPSRWQVIRAGLGILFSSVRFAATPTGGGA